MIKYPIDVILLIFNRKEVTFMGTMTPQKLLNQWTLENMTAEMATGHTL